MLLVIDAIKKSFNAAKRKAGSTIKGWLKKGEVIRGLSLYQNMFYKNLNVLNSNHGNKVLLSYINHPFRSDKNILYHSNIRQARIIAKVFDEFGYNVDVINYRYTGSIDYDRYAIVFGFGHPIENSFKNDINMKRIHYATEVESTVRNNAERARLDDIKKRKGMDLSSRRSSPWPEELSVTGCDAIFCTGNEWTMDSYRKLYNGAIYRTPIGVCRFFESNSIKRDWRASRANFLWFGGHGMVMKGLDLCIEAFDILGDNFNLHICGWYDEEFFSAYRSVLNKCGNITFYGPVKVDSDLFHELVESCAYVIFPSAAEAGCGSVLTAMGAGLVSVTTVETSIDNEGIGYRLSSPASVENIVSVVKTVSNVSEEELKENSRLSIEYVKKLHTFENYEKCFRDSLQDFLNHQT